MSKIVKEDDKVVVVDKDGKKSRRAGMSNYKSAKSKHPWLCRWWLRSRPFVYSANEPSGHEPIEFYVPWWAWLFELTHRMVFGSAKLEK